MSIIEVDISGKAGIEEDGISIELDIAKAGIALKKRADEGGQRP